MRVLLINSVCGIGSTGKICTDTAKKMEAMGHQVKIAYGRGTVPEQFRKYAVRIGTELDVKLSGLHTRLSDRHGFSNKYATKKFLQWVEKFNPDLLWLHNLHGYYINVEMLFNWIKSKPNMQVKWTLHDCWAFTGHCAYFSWNKCEQWTDKCLHCKHKTTYPSSFVASNSQNNFERKKAAFSGVKNMTLITPSKWLADLVKCSFLNDYPVEIRYNTIDTSIFKPTPSDFRQKTGIENKNVLLGVASVWDKRKGLEDFIKLSKLLNDNFVIVLVGLSNKQIKKMPKGIICIERTNSSRELAQIYTASDVFLNLTYEDNYPTVNLEAQACGTPCITYKTGGSVESVQAENVAEQGNLDDVVRIINRMLT